MRVMESRSMRWIEHVAGVGRMRNSYKTLVGNSEGKRPLGRHGRRREDNIRVDFREIEWEVCGLYSSGSG